jgi:hypothetical protein
MADGLLTSILGAIDRQKQATKAGLGLLVNDPMEFARNATARYFPTPEEVAQQRALEQSGNMAMNTPYMDKMFNLAQFQGSIKGIAKTQFDIANEIAQKNASEMLGLPLNNTAADRAKALGFNVPTYHGTTENFRIPDKDVFVSQAPSIANRYAFKNTEENSLVIPMLTKSNTPEFEHLNAVSYRLSPENVRSRFAAFDPARVNDPDLLAAGVPLGLLASTDVDLPKKPVKKPKK